MTAPRHVLHPITRLIVGGAQENTLYTAARLDPLRYRAEVVSGPETGSEGSLIEEAIALGIHLTILPPLVRRISPSNDLRALAALTGMMRRGRYSLVHTHSSKAGILGRAAARLARVPRVVHTVHGWSFHDYMPPRQRRFYILLEQRLAAVTDALVVVTERDIDKGLAAGIGRPEQYRLIRSAIPLDEFNPARVDRNAVRRELGLPLDAPVIGNIGRFSPQKNPLDWVRVAARIGHAEPRARFLLVGDGPLRGEVEAALAAEGLSGRSLLTGLRRDAPQMLAAMDIFLLTSLWEGLPRVIPEAMAMGVPVVATRADGATEVVRHHSTGFLCAPGDHEDYAACCLELLEDADLRHRMGLRSRELVPEFDLHTMVAKIEALYTELCRGLD